MKYPAEFVEKVKAVLSTLEMVPEEKENVLKMLRENDILLGDFLIHLARRRFTGREIVKLLNEQKLHVLYALAKRYAEYESLLEEWQSIKSSGEKTIIPSLWKHN